MAKATPEQIEVANKAWFASMRAIWAKRNPGEPFPGESYEKLDPSSRRFFNRAMENALNSASPENMRRLRERKLANPPEAGKE